MAIGVRISGDVSGPLCEYSWQFSEGLDDTQFAR